MQFRFRCYRTPNLAAHLLRTDTNERVELVELKGVAATTLPAALLEMQALALGTRCKKALYHASINTAPGVSCQARDAFPLS
jgi:hypothetical protein